MSGYTATMSTRDRFRPVGAATPVVEATAGTISAVAFGVASLLRRARVFHPEGVAFAATFTSSGPRGEPHGAPLLDEPGRHDAVVRFSRGVGLPESVADILGLAIRITDAHGDGAHQDLLLVTSSAAPGARHALVPTRTFLHPRWSTVLPYRLGGRRVVFGARPLRTGGDITRLDHLADELESGRLRFAIDVADVTRPWTEVGVLTMTAMLPDDEAESLRFNPANTGGGIEPTGVLQAVRRLAYRGSQAARPSPAAEAVN